MPRAFEDFKGLESGCRTKNDLNEQSRTSQLHEVGNRKELQVLTSRGPPHSNPGTGGGAFVSTLSLSRMAASTSETIDLKRVFLVRPLLLLARPRDPNPKNLFPSRRVRAADDYRRQSNPHVMTPRDSSHQSSRVSRLNRDPVEVSRTAESNLAAGA